MARGTSVKACTRLYAAALAKERTEERARPASNLVAVLARLHTCGLFPSGVCYGLLTGLSQVGLSLAPWPSSHNSFVNPRVLP
jgi:hypothetical protein